MKGLLLGLLFATSNSPTDLSAVSNAIGHTVEWKLNGELADNCTLATLGDVQDGSGAQLNVQCDVDEAVAGSVVLKLPGSAYQNHRVTFVMDAEDGAAMTS